LFEHDVLSGDLYVLSDVCCLRLLEFRLALIQLAVTANKADNVRRATDLIANASKQGAQLVSLPVSSVQFSMIVYVRPILIASSCHEHVSSRPAK